MTGKDMPSDAKVAAAVAKAFGIGQAAQMWLAGEDGDADDKKTATARKPYAQLAIIFACVNELISGIAGLTPVISTADEKIIEGGPVYDALFNNPNMSWTRFVTDTIGHYALTCDVFWVFTEKQGLRAKDIMVVSGSQMHPMTSNGRVDGVLVGWEFRGTGGQRATFSLDEVHQWRNFNPYDRFHGMGPLTAGKLSIDYSYGAGLFNASALNNGAEPGIILTTTGNLQPDQVQLLRSQFDARQRGPGNAKRTAVLTGGMGVETVAMNLVDMQMAELSMMTDVRICSAFRVPPEVIGIITEAQYGKGPALLDYVFNTVLPLACTFGCEVTAGILSKGYSDEHRSVELKHAKAFYGRTLTLGRNPQFRKARCGSVTSGHEVFLWFNADDHPIVEKYRREAAEKVLTFTKSGVRLNDIIFAYDLPFEARPEGNVSWRKMNEVPAEYILEAGLEGLTGPSAPEGQPDEEDDKSGIGDAVNVLAGQIGELKEAEQQKADDEGVRRRIWQNWAASWLPIEREYQEAMRRFFLRQQRILTNKLKAAWNELAGKSAATKEAVDQIVARVVFDLKQEGDKLRVINNIFFDKASQLGARQTLSEVAGLAGDELADAAESATQQAWLKGKKVISSFKISKVNEVTQELIGRQLAEGLDAGEGLKDLTERVRATLGSNRARAQRIARTQTAGAVGSGRHAGMKAAGVELKGWLTSRDNNVRPAHKTAEAAYADGIPVDQPFEVAGEMLMYPGDPNGSVANIVNCRCMTLARRAAGKAFDTAYYAHVTFYSSSDMVKDKAA